MEKQIVQVSYWLGLATSLVAMVWKGLEALQFAPEGFGSFKYMTLYKGGLLLFLISIATTGYASLKNQKA